jgi:hypothetical protein
MHWAVPPLPPYVFMAWCLVKHRDSVTFTVTSLFNSLLPSLSLRSKYRLHHPVVWHPPLFFFTLAPFDVGNPLNQIQPDCWTSLVPTSNITHKALCNLSTRWHHQMARGGLEWSGNTSQMAWKWSLFQHRRFQAWNASK